MSCNAPNFATVALVQPMSEYQPGEGFGIGHGGSDTASQADARPVPLTLTPAVTSPSAHGEDVEAGVVEWAAKGETPRSDVQLLSVN